MVLLVPRENPYQIQKDEQIGIYTGSCKKSYKKSYEFTVCECNKELKLRNGLVGHLGVSVG